MPSLPASAADQAVAPTTVLPQGVDRARGERLDDPIRRFTLLCLALTTAVGVIDALTGRHLILIGLLVIGPCMAVATGRSRPTVLVSVWAIGFAVVLGSPDGIWGTRIHFDYVGAVAVVAAVSSTAAVLLERRDVAAGLSHRLATSLDPPQPPNKELTNVSPDVDFVTTAFVGVLERSPDPDGLRHLVEALRSGMTREDVLLGMVESAEVAARTLYQPGLRVMHDDFWRLRQQADPSLRPICFLHTMKTAGTALRQVLVDLSAPWPILTNLLVDHLVCLPPALLDRAMLIAGHLPYEAVELLPPGIALCTVVREPVERTLSHHSHINTLLARRQTPPVSIEEFVYEPQWRTLWENYQARQLVHRVGLTGAWRTFSPTEMAASRGLSGPDAEYPLQSLFDSTPLDVGPDDLLGVAMARLDAIDLVGTTEDLGGLAGRLAAFWDRPVPTSVRRLRVSEQRTPRSQLPTAMLTTIRDATAVDAALYERARLIAQPPPW